MKKMLLVLSLLVWITGLCSAQSENAIEKTKIGLFKTKTAYKKCGITMTSAQFFKLIGEDPNMSEFVKPLAVNYIGDALLTAASSILIFWPISEKIGGADDPNWNLAYIGAGCVLLSIPFKKGFEKNADKAAKFYNNGYKKVPADFSLNLGSNGLGLAMKF